MLVPILLIILIGIVFFFVIPQLTKFRATLGINKILECKSLPFFQKLKLRFLGMKTPIVNGVAASWSFFLAEGGSLSGYSWDRLVSAEHAIWITFGLFVMSIWAHFKGLNTAAATPPVLTPLPGALPLAQDS